MTTTGSPDQPGIDDAAARIAELKRLYHSIRATLDVQLQEMGLATTSTPKTVLAKLNELQTAHLRVLAAEEAFEAQQPNVEISDDTDFDALRYEIGSKLDRLRRSILATELSDRLEGESPDGIALSV